MGKDKKKKNQTTEIVSKKPLNNRRLVGSTSEKVFILNFLLYQNVFSEIK